MSVHSQLTGLELHQPWNFIQETDPGAVGAGLHWLQVSTANVFRRNEANSAWLQLNGGALNDPTTTKGDVIARGASVLGRLAVGTDGQALVADAASSLGVKWGDVALTLPNYVAKQPEAIPTSPNAFDDEFDSGSLGGSWAWINQNGTTTNFVGTRIGIVKTASESPLTYLYKAITGTWTVTSKIWIPAATATNGYAGMAVGDSSNGKISEIIIGPGGTSATIQNWTAYNNFSAQPVSFAPFTPFQFAFLQIQLDSTNLTFRVSSDGAFFSQVYQVAKATFLTGGQDRIGFIVRCDTTAMQLVADFIRKL